MTISSSPCRARAQYEAKMDSLSRRNNSHRIVLLDRLLAPISFCFALVRFGRISIASVKVPVLLFIPPLESNPRLPVPSPAAGRLHLSLGTCWYESEVWTTALFNSPSYPSKPQMEHQFVHAIANLNYCRVT